MLHVPPLGCYRYSSVVARVIEHGRVRMNLPPIHHTTAHSFYQFLRHLVVWFHLLVVQHPGRLHPEVGWGVRGDAVTC